MFSINGLCYLSPSLSHFLSLTHPHKHFISLSLTHTNTLSLSHSHALAFISSSAGESRVSVTQVGFFQHKTSKQGIPTKQNKKETLTSDEYLASKQVFRWIWCLSPFHKQVLCSLQLCPKRCPPKISEHQSLNPKSGYKPSSCQKLGFTWSGISQ